jgi:hypothetical protein
MRIYSRYHRYMSAKGWQKSMLEGSYISDSGNYTAELRTAGYYAEFGCKMVRHYAIRRRGQSAIIAMVPTLKEASESYR